MNPPRWLVGLADPPPWLYSDVIFSTTSSLSDSFNPFGESIPTPEPICSNIRCRSVEEDILSMGDENAGTVLLLDGDNAEIASSPFTPVESVRSRCRS